MGYSARRGFTSGNMKATGAQRQAAVQQQIAQMQEAMNAAQTEVENRSFTASAGGGAVEVTVTGKKELTKIKLSEEAVDPEDIETLEDMIMAAVNEALKQADAANGELMGKMAGGLSF